MNLDRGLIKRQAKELIRGKVMKLFVVYFIISLCVSLVSSIGGGLMVYYNSQYPSSYPYGNFFDFDDDYYDDYDDYDDDSEYYDSFNNFGKEGSDFYSFGSDNVLPSAKVIDTAYPAAAGVSVGLSYLGAIAALLLSPLTVTFASFMVLFVRGKEFEADTGIKYVFKNSFNESYGRKLGGYFLKGVITLLLSYLFLIPGIIFNYSAYFTYQILCDYPELKPMDAIKLSKKMIKGNRTELFLLDLSFIPWALLCVFIFPIIYVVPYYETTVALYYENFRIRALQQGRVTEDDFLSERQKMQKYGMNGNPGQYYAPNGPQQGGYQQGPVNPQQNTNTYNPAGAQQQNTDYYNPAGAQQQYQQQYYQPQAQQPAEPVQPQPSYEAPIQEEPPVTNSEPTEVDYEPVSNTEPEPPAPEETSAE